MSTSHGTVSTDSLGMTTPPAKEARLRVEGRGSTEGMSQIKGQCSKFWLGMTTPPAKEARLQQRTEGGMQLVAAVWA